MQEVDALYTGVNIYPVMYAVCTKTSNVWWKLGGTGWVKSGFKPDEVQYITYLTRVNVNNPRIKLG